MTRGKLPPQRWRSRAASAAAAPSSSAGTASESLPARTRSWSRTRSRRRTWHWLPRDGCPVVLMTACSPCSTAPRSPSLFPSGASRGTGACPSPPSVPGATRTPTSIPRWSLPATRRRRGRRPWARSRSPAPAGCRSSAFLPTDPVRAAFDAASPAIRIIAASQRPLARRRPAATGVDGLSAQRRKKLRQARRRLEAELDGPVVARDHVTDRAAAVERFLTLERAGWKGRAGTALVSGDGEAEMVREALLAAEHVQLWELGLEGGPPVAALLRSSPAVSRSISADRRRARRGVLPRDAA